MLRALLGDNLSGVMEKAGEADGAAGRDIFHLVLNGDELLVWCEAGWDVWVGLFVRQAVLGGGGAVLWVLLLVDWYLLTSDLQGYRVLSYNTVGAWSPILYPIVRGLQESSPGQPATYPTLDNVDWGTVR